MISLGGAVDARAGDEFGNDEGDGSLLDQVGSDVQVKRPVLVEGASFEFNAATAVDSGAGTIDIGDPQRAESNPVRLAVPRTSSS